jgi:hypothetical protein
MPFDVHGAANLEMEVNIFPFNFQELQTSFITPIVVDVMGYKGGFAGNMYFILV